jgi:hypothetical protein
MKTLTETLNEITEAKQKKTLIKKLKENESYVLLTLFQGNFNNNIVFPFPEGAPPFRKKEEKIEITKEIINKIGACTKNAKGLVLAKEKIFIDLLESIHQDDAELICLMKDKKLETKYPKLTKEIVQEAFPNIL